MNDQKCQSGMGVSIAFGVIVLYFAPFIAIALDELVFRTFLFSRNSPEWVEEFVRVVYWPVITFIRFLF